MSVRGFGTALFVHWWLFQNWIRRAARSAFFWIICAALAFVVANMVASMLGGGPTADLADRVERSHLEAASAAVFSIASLIGIWRGASQTPRASLADVVVMMNSPLSARAQYGYLIARDFGENGVVISAWFAAGFGGIMVRTGDPWMPVRMFFVVLVAITLSEALRYAVWSTTERFLIGTEGLGHRLRQITRGVVLLAGGVLAGTLLLDAVGEPPGEWAASLDAVVSRLSQVAVIPPASWSASVLDGTGNDLTAAAGLLLMLAAVTGLALYNAREIVEPISLNAERTTDARGKMTEPGADVQWSAISQIGATPRMRIAVRPFGSGAWALLWASVVRWLRYEVAAAGFGLLMLGGLGVAAALLIRFDYFPVYAGWALAVFTPLLSSVNSFLDELRKQFLFLTPGAAWKRLLAGAVTSVLDGTIAGLIIIIALAALQAISILEAAGLLVLCLALSIVSQGAVVLVQVVLPYSTPHRLRMTVTMFVSMFGGMPALVLGIVIYILSSAVLGMLAGALVGLVTGVIMLAIGVRFFNRVEFAG